MGTTIGGKDIATTGSGHVSPGPPATSLIPPTPPAGLVPAPFPYVASSSSATGTSDRLTVGGKPVLVEGSSMDVERPGNQPDGAAHTSSNYVAGGIRRRATCRGRVVLMIATTRGISVHITGDERGQCR
ncbi:Rhs-family protein [Minicystis rosea]|nr:Rhs-family protein [Minicystis rosea]